MSDQDAVGDYPFPNEDAHMEEEQERAAKLIWVGVANSTEHKLEINWSVTGAHSGALWDRFQKKKSDFPKTFRKILF